MKKGRIISTKTEIVSRHKHFWQLHQSGFSSGAFGANRYATFYCECGAEKVVKIKRVGE